MEEKRKKMINWLLAIGLTVLILFVVITGSVLHKKKKELDDINNKNDIVKPSEKLVISTAYNDNDYLLNYIK